MSDALLVASVTAALVAAMLLGNAAGPTRSLVATGVLTAAQARLVDDGLPVDEAMAIPDECAQRCTFTIAREFPLVCDCPGGI